MDENVGLTRTLLNFRAATVLGVCAGLLSAALRVFVTAPSEEAALSTIESMFQRPTVLVTYDLVVTAGLLVIYATRQRSNLYIRRLAFYTMFLTGLVSANVAPMLRIAAAK